ncbi:MAG: VanZ family protein [Gemmatimonadota bacterium]
MRAWFPVLAWKAVIFLASSLPSSLLPEANVQQADKWAHAAVYLVLGLLTARALAAGGAQGAAVGFGTLAVAGAFGAGVEGWQAVVARDPSAADWAADAAGAALGVLIWRVWPARRPGVPTPQPS